MAKTCKHGVLTTSLCSECHLLRQGKTPTRTLTLSDIKQNLTEVAIEFWWQDEDDYDRQDPDEFAKAIQNCANVAAIANHLIGEFGMSGEQAWEFVMDACTTPEEKGGA